MHFLFLILYILYMIYFFANFKDTFLLKNFIFRWSDDASVRRNRRTNLVCLSLNRSVARWTPWKYHRSLKIPVALPAMLWWGIQRFQDGPPVRLTKVVQFVHRNRQKVSLSNNCDNFTFSFVDKYNICNCILKHWKKIVYSYSLLSKILVHTHTPVEIIWLLL